MADESPHDDTAPIEGRMAELEVEFEQLSTEIRQIWAVLVGGVIVVIGRIFAPELVPLFSLPVGVYVLYLLYGRFTEYAQS